MKFSQKRFFVIPLALTLVMLLCTCLGMTVFAAEPEETKGMECYTMEVNSEGVQSISNANGDTVMPYSSISGYGRETLRGKAGAKPGFIIYPKASGWGGMGATIKASSSWNGEMTVAIIDPDVGLMRDGIKARSNGETYVNNMFHRSPYQVAIAFDGIPDGVTVEVEVWLYG